MYAQRTQESCIRHIKVNGGKSYIFHRPDKDFFWDFKSYFNGAHYASIAGKSGINPNTMLLRWNENNCAAFLDLNDPTKKGDSFKIGDFFWMSAGQGPKPNVGNSNNSNDSRRSCSSRNHIDDNSRGNAIQQYLY